MEYKLEIDREDFMAAALRLEGIEVRASGPALRARLERVTAELRAGEAGGGDERRRAIRDLLRNGRFRPSGRSKPAQEYLMKVWSAQGTLDLINNAVDANNIFSLRHGLPVSAFDGGKIRGDRLTVRLGREGERYVFNAAGQELDCRDLVLVADERGPIGSPVKDSQATKLFEGATSVIYVVYGSREVMSPEDLLATSVELAQMMNEECPDFEEGDVVLFGDA